MGQVALGFRSLLIKAAIFVIMAGLLAWALGGTLFPRPTIADRPGEVGGVHWQVAVGGDLGGIRWTLLGEDAAIVLEGYYASVAGPVLVDGGTWVATDSDGTWSTWRIDAGSAEAMSAPSSVRSTLFGMSR